MVVSASDEHVVAKEDEGVSIVDLLASIDDPNEEGGLGRGYGREVEDGLGVEGVEDGATVVELAAEGGGVNEVVVVGDGDRAKVVVGEEGHP